VAESAVAALDPDLASLAQVRDASGASPLHATAVAESRERIVAGHRLCAERPEVGAVRDETVEVAGGSIGVRVFSPARTPTGTLVHLHGGGWITGDLEYGEEFCRHLVRASGLRVVSVDYRMAPEHPFPVPLDDCVAGIRWAARDHAPGTPFGVLGDSAGGNLAAAALQRLRGELTVELQVLVYPVTDSDFTRESYVRCADAFPLGRKDLEFCFAQYVPDEARWTDPEVAPLRADLTGMPPAVVLVVGHDPLHDEGVAYAERLAEAGVDVRLLSYPTLCHGFLRFTGASAASARARDELVEVVAELSALSGDNSRDT
jgi:acetyl esterase